MDENPEMGRMQAPPPAMPPALPVLPPLRGSDLPEGFHATGRLVPTGVRWTFFEILRGRTLLVLLAAAGLFALLALPVLLQDAAGPAAAIGALLKGISEYATGDSYRFAFLVAPAVNVFLPIIAVLGIPCALVIRAVYNRREEKAAPVPRAGEVHAYDTRFTWNVLYAALLGSLVFVVLFLVIMQLFLWALALLYQIGLIPLEAGPSDTAMLLLTFVALALTEIPNRWLAGPGDANDLVAEKLAAGGYDAWLLERLRDPEGRALIARLLGAGAADTVRGAVLLARGLELRERIADSSEVLGDLLDAFATILTFGSFGLVAGAAEDARAACAENAARGVRFGDPAFAWPQPAPGELGRKNLRTALLAGLLFLLIVIAQPLVMAA